MKLKVLLDMAGIAYSNNIDSINITKIVSDSRKVCKGCLYVCIRGIKNDGHLFIKDAIDLGAAAVIAEEGAIVDTSGNTSEFVIFVPNTHQAIACLFDAWYGKPSAKLKFVAVTGTNGKTSVTYILKRIFEMAMYRCGLIGTISCLSMDRQLICNNPDALANMTTPDPAQLYEMLSLMVDDNVEYVFIEASSHALALDKLFPIHFDAAIFTNLTSEHLDFHGSIDNYIDAKKKLFKMSDLTVVNMDSEYYNDIANVSTGRVVCCSLMNDKADYFAKDIVDHGMDGFNCIFCSDSTAIKIRSSLLGRFNIMNVLQSAACALELGIKPMFIAKAVSTVVGINGRMERIKFKSDIGFSVFIDYAHTPDALEKLLIAVRGFCDSNQRIVVVFGCGGGRDKSKRPAMGEIATRLADFAVITSDNCRDELPRDIINNIVMGISGRENYTIIVDRRAAIEQTIRNANRDDVIILAGKGHEQYEINQHGKVPFSEKQIVLNEVKNLNG